MKFLVRFLKRLWAWILGRDSTLGQIRLEELPDRLMKDTIYLAGEGDHLWFAAMLCPCGCGETLHMSLLSNDRPRWMLSSHTDGTVSLHPSVWRKVGCRSHFFIRR